MLLNFLHCLFMYWNIAHILQMIRCIRKNAFFHQNEIKKKKKLCYVYYNNQMQINQKNWIFYIYSKILHFWMKKMQTKLYEIYKLILIMETINLPYNNNKKRTKIFKKSNWIKISWKIFSFLMDVNWKELQFSLKACALL